MTPEPHVKGQKCDIGCEFKIKNGENCAAERFEKFEKHQTHKLEFVWKLKAKFEPSSVSIQFWLLIKT